MAHQHNQAIQLKIGLSHHTAIAYKQLLDMSRLRTAVFTVTIHHPAP